MTISWPCTRARIFFSCSVSVTSMPSAKGYSASRMSVGSSCSSGFERAARVLFTCRPTAMSRNGETCVLRSTPKHTKNTGLAASQQFSTTYIAMRSMCSLTTTFGIKLASSFFSSFSASLSLISSSSFSLISSSSSLTSSFFSSLTSSLGFSDSKDLAASEKASPTFAPTVVAQSSRTKIQGDGSSATWPTNSEASTSNTGSFTLWSLCMVTACRSPSVFCCSDTSTLKAGLFSSPICTRLRKCGATGDSGRLSRTRMVASDTEAEMSMLW